MSKFRTIALSGLVLATSSFAADWTPVPARFENDRIFALVQKDGRTLSFYTDSGGGLFPFTYSDIASFLKMPSQGEERINEGREVMGLSTFSNFGGIPLPESWKSKVRVFDSNGKTEATELREFFGDGFFGATWFADRAWKFDYASRKLWTANSLPSGHPGQEVSLGFRVVDGKRTSHQPRIEAVLDNEKMSMLLDTGATSFFTPIAQKKLGFQGPFHASSFVRKSVAEKWAKKHPDWKRIEKGDRFSRGQDLIRVPDLEVGRLKVGPVWFALRDDSVYDDYSADIMDRRIEGAIGGNVWRNFILVIDYTAAKAFLAPVSKQESGKQSP